MDSQDAGLRVERRPRSHDGLALNALADGLERFSGTSVLLRHAPPIRTSACSAHALVATTEARSRDILAGESTQTHSAHYVPHGDLSGGVHSERMYAVVQHHTAHKAMFPVDDLVWFESQGDRVGSDLTHIVCCPRPRCNLDSLVLLTQACTRMYCIAVHGAV